MKYQLFIEDSFLIDDPKAGQLVPFKLRPVQQDYYDLLQRDYNIEKNGLTVPVREDIMKARREGFSSLILALFCADDILNDNPTNSFVYSYKDDATDVFKQRYKNYALSYFAGVNNLDYANFPQDDIKAFAKEVFSKDEGGEVVYKHNGASFGCGTASARTGGRGGVLQKLLFSEHHHYPDTEKMSAQEIVDGTAQQVDKEAGWIFKESTGNGVGNHAYKSYMKAHNGLSRYKGRFFGWRSHYTPEQFAVIASEFVDPDMLKQEYPETVEEAFMYSGQPFTTRPQLERLIDIKADKKILYKLAIQGDNYIDQCEMIKQTLVMLQQNNPNRDLFVGIDVAKIKDHTFVTVLMRENLAMPGGIKCIAIDSTGAGDFMPDWFVKNTRWYVVPVKFSRPSKDIMYKNLQTVIANKLTSIPPEKLSEHSIEYRSEEDKLFWEQMLSLQKSYKGELLVVAHPPDGHDDAPDSWALAEHAWVQIMGVPKAQKTPDQSAAVQDPVQAMLRSTAMTTNSVAFNNKRSQYE